MCSLIRLLLAYGFYYAYQPTISFLKHWKGFLTCVAWLARALVAVDLVDARPVVTRVAFAVVHVDFTVDTCGIIHWV